MEVGRTKALALPDDNDSDDVIDFGDHIYNDGMYISPEREKVRHRGIGDESRARALWANQGLYTQN